MSVRFPRPFSDTIRSESPCLSSCMPTTSSSSRRFIPITPIALLPVGLTSVSLNLMHWPSFVTRIISQSLSVSLTSISSSSSRIPIAWIPVLRIFANSLIGVFLTIPFLVAINILSLSAICFTSIGITAAIFSPGWSCNKLIIAVPLDVLPDSGISYAFNLYARPVFVKNVRIWCDVVINKSCI